jgi:hypothetical protein
MIDPVNTSPETLVELDARETSEFEISLLWDARAVNARDPGHALNGLC